MYLEMKLLQTVAVDPLEDALATAWLSVLATC